MQQELIREATIGDIPAILEIALMFAAEVPDVVPVDTASIERTLKYLIEDENGCLFCDMEAKSVVGGLRFPYFYNINMMAAQELFWWVDKEKRGGVTAKLLYGSFEQWAKKSGCNFIHMVALSNDTHDIAERAYKKSGFTRLETVYTKAL